MNFNKIPISKVMLWAKEEQDKWEKLVGCWFFHKTNGRLKLIVVRLPYLDFLSVDDDNYPRMLSGQKLFTYNITRAFESFFEFLHRDHNCPKHLINFDPASVNKIKQWCKKHNLPVNEVDKLINTDRDRARRIIGAYLDLKIIPRKDQSWLKEFEAYLLLDSYYRRILYQGGYTDNPKFFSDCENTEVNHKGFWSIGSLHSYRPVRKIPQSEWPEDSARILAFKDGKADVIELYSERLDKIIGKNIVICCAPSSGENDWGPGLVSTVEILGNRHNRQAAPKLLRRTKFTQKRAHGGDRSIQLNYETIEVEDEALPFGIKEKPIVVIDDITTSGNTMTACSRLLWEAGANCVGAFTLGRTEEYGYK